MREMCVASGRRVCKPAWLTSALVTEVCRGAVECSPPCPVRHRTLPPAKESGFNPTSRELIHARTPRRVRLSATPWTVQSTEFPRPEYWSGEPLPSPAHLPLPGSRTVLQGFLLHVGEKRHKRNNGGHRNAEGCHWPVLLIWMHLLARALPWRAGTGARSPGFEARAAGR